VPDSVWISPTCAFVHWSIDCCIFTKGETQHVGMHMRCKERRESARWKRKRWLKCVLSFWWLWEAGVCCAVSWWELTVMLLCSSKFGFQWASCCQVAERQCCLQTYKWKWGKRSGTIPAILKALLTKCGTCVHIKTCWVFGVLVHKMFHSVLSPDKHFGNGGCGVKHHRWFDIIMWWKEQNPVYSVHSSSSQSLLEISFGKINHRRKWNLLGL
jgi:hypothetical protein